MKRTRLTIMALALVLAAAAPAMAGGTMKYRRHAGHYDVEVAADAQTRTPGETTFRAEFDTWRDVTRYARARGLRLVPMRRGRLTWLK